MAYDVIIIGAGPAGLTAGIYARSKMMSTLILESGKVGGQLVALYPEKGIHNYPGYETVQARKLSDKLYAQAESMECEIREYQKVTDIIDGDQKLIVKTQNAEYETMSVIIAIGMGEFTPRKMDAPGENELEGKGISYFLPLKEELVGKKVVLFGGGNSAIEMAMVADQVTETALVHRRPEFRADEINVKNLAESQVKTYMSTTVKSFNGTDRLESITLLDAEKKEIEVPADLAVINIGITADLGVLNKWGLELTENGLIKAGFDMSTNRNGIFACGDVVDYPGKYKQIITGCGEAATACLSAYKFVKKPYWA
jgi:thioredoxin reductase (NADPH)